LIELLKPKFGLNAIFIASAMYGIAHYTKPLPEQLGAFFVGLVLGYIGDRYRTFYFGIIIHYLIALSMDSFLVVPALLR
jgi:membrane protease YdiL (CAAX protease family)